MQEVQKALGTSTCPGTGGGAGTRKWQHTGNSGVGEGVSIIEVYLSPMFVRFSLNR